MAHSQVVALGFFDGVHRGHGALLICARRLADHLCCPAVAMTFDIHPDTIITGNAVPLINQAADREAIMRQNYGIDRMILARFDQEMRELPWDQFIESYLFGKLCAAGVVCGHDFRFGYRGEGTAQSLKAFCAARGIVCEVIEEIKLDGVTVSSTAIRKLLQAGELVEANRFLGHPHRLSGVVCKGSGVGRTLGFPTANLPIPSEVLVPAYGVYAASVLLDKTSYCAVANVGVHPTVGALPAPVVEAWLFDFDGDLYGKRVTVEFHARLRGEQRFSDVEALRAQVRRDVEDAKKYFSK